MNAANFSWFRSKGITLSNYFGVTHPSEPNYMAAIAGDYFGMQNDAFNRNPRNVSTIIDLLEHRGISWGLYQEDQPYTGFEGFAWVNHKNGKNDYVRKHNPAILHDSVATSEQRLSQIKNLSLIDTESSMFHRDLKENKLPQWMFITPNMTSDGHDTSVTVAGDWARTFLEPLLKNKHFMDNTLVLITWDENESYARQNHILGILLGDAVPKHLVGTTDNNFYNHYSEISTVQANWDLDTLGRWDVGANVFNLVARKTGDKLRKWKSNTIDKYFWNASYAGPFNTAGGNQQYVAPNLDLEHTFSGRKVFGPIKKEWKGSEAPSYYKDTIEVNDGMNPPKGYEPVKSK
jgi:acid phosphatase